MSKPKVLDNPVEQKFRDLAARWKAAAGVTSSLTERFAHPAYKEIIATGEPALTCLFAEVEREPDWWFAALKSITGADPVAATSRGKLGEMTRAWLEWGRAQGYRW